MGYFLTADEFYESPIWAVLSEAVRTRVSAIRDGFHCVLSAAARYATDGYCNQAMVSKALAGDYNKGERAAIAEAFTRTVLEAPPLIHQRGDECDCIPRGWPEGWDYYIHHFLKRHPSKKKKDLKAEKRRDLADSTLKAKILEDKGNYCNYCWSGPLSNKLGAAGYAEARKLRRTFDHIDPREGAGIDGANMVPACESCNQDKGGCTPELAGMRLLPPPTAAQIAAFPINCRGKYTVFQLPSQDPNHPANHLPHQAGINAESINDRINAPINDRITESHGDSIVDSNVDCIVDSGVDCLDVPDDDQTAPHLSKRDAQSTGNVECESVWSGRDGQPATPPGEPYYWPTDVVIPNQSSERESLWCTPAGLAWLARIWNARGVKPPFPPKGG